MLLDQWTAVYDKERREGVIMPHLEPAREYEQLSIIEWNIYLRSNSLHSNERMSL